MKSECLEIDIRRARAEDLVRTILNIVRPHVADDGRNRLNEIYWALSDHLRDAGAEIVTDAIRRECGLPARGPRGWTDAELAALELRRLDVISRPIIVEKTI